MQRESVFLQEHLHVCGSCTNKCFLRSEQGPQGLQKAKGKTSKLERQQRERKKIHATPLPRPQLHPHPARGPPHPSTPWKALMPAEDKRERRKEAAVTRSRPAGSGGRGRAECEERAGLSHGHKCKSQATGPHWLPPLRKHTLTLQPARDANRGQLLPA